MLAQVGAAQPKFLHPDRVRYDGHCFSIEGKDTFLFSGAFHYFRCPKELWRDRFQKIKDAGFNAVETYVAWNWNEREKPAGLDDYSRVDLRDLDEWLTMAEDEFGFYTIVRPGPYICSEWASGGFPNWLQAFMPAKPKRNMWYRSDDPLFEAWSKHWFTAVAKVVDRHQLSKRAPGQKGMILWQVENEYNFVDLPEESKRNCVHSLIQTSLDLGIEVPIFGCWTDVIRYPKGDPILSQAFDNPNQYNRWDIENVIGAIQSQHDAQPWAPKMVTEFQGGWFGGVGGQAAIEQDGINAVQTSSHTLLAIANGLTGLNYYMLFGGTNFGDWAGEGITTSYDYAAPIREWGATGDKYRGVQAIGRMLQQYGTELARAEQAPAPQASNAQVKVYARRAVSGATYLFVWNSSRKEDAAGTVDGISFDLPAFSTAVYRYEGDIKSGKWIVEGHTGNDDASQTEPVGIPVMDGTMSTGEPVDWKVAADGKGSTTDLGVWDSRPVFYKFEKPQAGSGFMWLQLARDSDLYAPGLGSPEPRQGGLAWPLMSGTAVLFNPGWPNGGNGMEKPRGITMARLTKELPQGKTLTDWKSKRLTDPKDRSLVGVDVDTSGWDADANPSRFPVRTAVIARSEINLDADPKPETVLSTDGIDDVADFYVNGQLVGHIDQYGIPASFPVGKVLHKGRNVVAVVIRNNDGPGGFVGSTSLEMPLPESSPLPLQWTTDVKWGAPAAYQLSNIPQLPVNEHPKIEGPRKHTGALIVKTTLTFDKPGEGPWQIVLKAGGDGFLTLNGHPLGRFWEVGPQRGFYLPEPWLQAKNVLEYVAIPGRMGDRIVAAELKQF